MTDTPEPVEVRRNERGAWSVYIGGRFISDHRDHVGARLAAQAHVRAAGVQS